LDDDRVIQEMNKESVPMFTGASGKTGDVAAIRRDMEKANKRKLQKVHMKFISPLEVY
jgi:hypothetical protein